ncbi:hypothetical protein HHI36_008009 [Cryptolaemus montrouzieri]|uniref:Uncharacterized protein n=1 Tax=Cryptolaemus montrouzieri TaxID=559131 RepID=A0ABD2MRJ8_9CUCU
MAGTDTQKQWQIINKLIPSKNYKNHREIRMLEKENADREAPFGEIHNLSSLFLTVVDEYEIKKALSEVKVGTAAGYDGIKKSDVDCISTEVLPILLIENISKTNTEKALKKLLEKEEEIEISQEKLEGQKQRNQDQASHLAHKSLQAEATLAEIKARMFDRLFTKLTDVMMQKIENLENKNILKQKVGDNTSAAGIEKGKTATGSRSQDMEIVQQRKEKTHEEKSEYRRLVSEQQKLANTLIHLESDVGKTPGVLTSDKKAETCEEPVEGLPKLISNPQSYAEALKAPNAFQRTPSGVVNRKKKTNAVSERKTGAVSNRPSVAKIIVPRTNHDRPSPIKGTNSQDAA